MRFEAVETKDADDVAHRARARQRHETYAPGTTRSSPSGSKCRWLLVTGAPRSGTTFLNQLLNSHPQVAVATENGLDAIAEKMLSVLTLRRVESDGRDTASEAEVCDPARFGDLALEAFRLMFGKRALSIVGDKMPGCDADRLVHRALLGALAQIHIVRRPRDVIASSMRRRHNTILGFDDWHVRAVEQAIMEWVNAWERLARMTDDPDVLVLSYDRFRFGEMDQVAAIEAFLNVERGLFRHAFTASPPAMQMTDAEEATVARILGELDGLVAEDVHLALRTHPRVLVALEVGHTVHFDADHPLNALLLKEGFGEAEASGTWSVEKETRVAFRLPADLNQSVYAILTFSAFWGGRSVFRLVVGADGEDRRTHDYEPAERCLVAVPCRPDRQGVVSLQFELPMRKTPDEEPLADPRQLGVLVRSLTLFQV